MNFHADHAAKERQMLIHGTPLSKVTAFLAGALTMTIIFAIVCVFTYWVLIALVREADTRAAKALVIGISRMDAACLEWRETDGKWYCVRR